MAKNELDITTLTPEQRDARLALDVERLLRFGRKHKLIKDLDVLVARNTLLDLLALAAPSEAKPPKENPETPAGRDGRAGRPEGAVRRRGEPVPHQL